MGNLLRETEWGYSYIPAVFQYSAGVVASDGYRINRVIFPDNPALEVGYDRIARFLVERGLEYTALCACELRSPEPLSVDGFEQFNRKYIKRLENWGIVQADDNPIARSNVCPVENNLDGVVFFAFSYVVKEDAAKGNFVIAGSAEATEGAGVSLENNIISYNDWSEKGIKEKGIWVLNEMERRLRTVGASWRGVNGIHVYSARNWQGVLQTEMISREIRRKGLEWWIARPPVIGLEFEMDCRSVGNEEYWMQR